VRILIHGLNFAPELVGVGKFTGEMAEWLAERGHEVRVVTAPPFNPASKVSPGYSSWRYRREDSVYPRVVNTSDQELIRLGSRHVSPASVSLAATRATGDSVQSALLVSEQLPENEVSEGGKLSVFRCPLWVPRRPGAAERIVHLASFAFSSFWSMMRQVPWRAQVVIAIEPTLFCAPNAWVTARLTGAKIWFHIQDLEADAAFELGLLTSARLRQIVWSLEQKAMRAFGRVSTISEKMLIRVTQKGVNPINCVLFPNWVDTKAIFPLQNPSVLRAELGVSPKAIVALYSGTMAQKQGLDVLADAIRKLAHRNELQFVFCGDGPSKPILADLASQLKNVHLIPLQPVERLNELLNLADIHLLPQRGNAADLVMPSKLTGMLASGRPVVASASAGTQLAEVVDGRGIVVPPEDVAALAWAIDQLASHSGLREKLGRSARSYAVSYLEKDTVLQRFERELLAFASGTIESQPLSS
jgi:colanic acid biosynthesis glycosyl transferase WcaI